MEVAAQRRSQEVDLGGQQELAGVLRQWKLHLVRRVRLVHGSRLQPIEIAKLPTEIKLTMVWLLSRNRRRGQITSPLKSVFRGLIPKDRQEPKRGCVQEFHPTSWTLGERSGVSECGFYFR